MNVRTVRIETPEKIVFTYALARSGTRMAAWMIDFLIQMTALIVVLLIFGNYLAFDISAKSQGLYFLYAFYLILLFFQQWGYYILFETILNGQTPGKKVMGIAVIENNGISLKFSTIVLRNLIRIIDSIPGCYLIGGCVTVCDRYTRRLGDIIAGTYVIENHIHIVKEPVSSVFFLYSSAENEIKEQRRIIKDRLNEEELWVIRKFLNEINSLPESRRTDIAWAIAGKLKKRVGETEQIGNPVQYIEKIYKEHTNDAPQ